MKQVILRMVVAVVLAAASWGAWHESVLAARVADSADSLATLRLELDDSLRPEAALSDAFGGVPLATQIRDQRATVEYWLSRFDDVMQVDREEGDPAVLQMAANASFRTVMRDAPLAGEAAAQRLDGVLQAYANVLKASPDAIDAAYNYEFVARVRDRVASLPTPKPQKNAPPPPPAPRNRAVTLRPGDLPPGATVHGRPGGPPPEQKGEDFEILAPMEYGERESQPESTPGGQLKRKG